MIGVSILNAYFRHSRLSNADARMANPRKERCCMVLVKRRRVGITGIESGRSGIWDERSNGRGESEGVR